MSTKSLISFVIPVFNEQDNLKWHYEKLLDYFSKREFKYEIIYIDDGSSDDSRELIKGLKATNPCVRYLSFSRNFGKEAATSAGLREASGDAVVMIDADGQHPIETVDSFIKEWNNGFEVVVGMRKSNSKEGAIKKYGSKLFYKLLNSIVSGDVMPGSTDFRLVDRAVVDEFNKFTEHNRITRGLIDWLGFKRAYVEFNAPARHGGKATYSFRKLLKLALHAFVSQTTKPLQFAGMLGFVVMFISAGLSTFVLVEKYLFGDVFNLAITGTAILGLFISFLIGLVLICQWLLALYVESIHSETQNRPLYVIRDKDL